MTLEEYLHLTQDLVNEDGELDRPKFQKLVLRRLKLYIQRQAADAVKYHEVRVFVCALCDELYLCTLQLTKYACPFRVSPTLVHCYRARNIFWRARYYLFVHNSRQAVS